MKTAIICDPDKIDYIYDLLVDPNQGQGVLSGSKVCIQEHVNVPDLMEFELNKEEIKALQKLPEVKMAWVQFASAGHFYTPVSQIGIPKFATTTTFNGSAFQIPHSLYYCQDYTLATTDTNLNGTPVSLSSVDCSNVDILVMDSGVDANNPEFADNNGNSRVVQFNWTQLTESPTNVQIVGYQSPNYYEDTNGHGSACASLAAGRRCGFAKNARIYSLRANNIGQTNDGFSETDCLRLALAFQKAKKLNLYGLSASRPTIMTNSWGYSYQIQVRDDFNQTVNGLRWNGSLGNSLSAINILPAFDSTVDAYIRQISLEGVHILCAAGNHNAYIDHTKNNIINVHLWRPANGSNIPYFTVRTQESDAAFTNYNQVYTQNGVSLTYGYNNFSTSLVPYNYVSPNIGWPGFTNPVPYSKEQYPVIIVGDITPIGSLGPDSHLYRDGYPKAEFSVLSALTTESRIITNNTVRYTSPRGPYFVKSNYSNFGPAVDIYAPGRGCWAVYSNTIKSYDPIFNQGTYFEPNTNDVPFIKINNNLKYQYFNGTSAACPIVAGILATYLTDFPSATPLQARNWLLTSALSGQIMTTTSTFSGISSYNAAPGWGGTALTQTVSAAFGYDMFGQIRGELSNRYNMGIYGFLLRVNSPFFKRLNIDEAFVGARFFDSNNLVPQAFPLRKSIINVDLNNFPDTMTTQAGTTLVRTTSSTLLPVTIAANSPMLSTFGFSSRRRVTSFADLTPGLPGLPTITSITVGNQSVTVFFEPPTNISTSLINYDYSLDNGLNWISRYPTSTSIPLVITGLNNGTAYTIRIRAVSLTGPGPSSNAITATPGVFSITVLGGGGGGGSGYCTATGGNGGHGGMVITTRPLPVGGSYSVVIGGGGAAAQSSGSRYNLGVDGGPGSQSYFDTIYGNGGAGGLRANSYARSADGSTSGTIAGDIITIGPYNGYGQGGIGGTQNNNCEYSNSAQSGGSQGLVVITYQGPQRATGGSYSNNGTISTHTFTGNGTFTITN